MFCLAVGSIVRGYSELTGHSDRRQKIIRTLQVELIRSEIGESGASVRHTFVVWWRAGPFGTRSRSTNWMGRDQSSSRLRFKQEYLLTS